MKLYKSFSGVNGEEINVDGEEVNKIVTYFKASSKHCDKDEVINWGIKCKILPQFFYIYRFVYAYYNAVQKIFIFGKGFRKL